MEMEESQDVQSSGTRVLRPPAPPQEQQEAQRAGGAVNPNAQGQWRKFARIGAFVDIGFDIEGILMVIFLGIGLLEFIDLASYRKAKGLEDPISVIYYIIFIVGFVTPFLYGVAIWLSVVLLKEIKVASPRSMRRVKLNRLFNIILAAVELIYAIIIFISQYFTIIGVSSIIGAIIRAGRVYIVHRFMKEMAGGVAEIPANTAQYT